MHSFAPIPPERLLDFSRRSTQFMGAVKLSTKRPMRAAVLTECLTKSLFQTLILPQGMAEELQWPLARLHASRFACGTQVNGLIEQQHG